MDPVVYALFAIKGVRLGKSESRKVGSRSRQKLSVCTSVIASGYDYPQPLCLKSGLEIDTSSEVL
jgi:hypothetical protein